MRHTEILTGRVGQIRDLVELEKDNCLINFSIAETPRVKKGNEWVDGVTIWTDVTVFGDEARNFLKSDIKPGTFITVIGNRTAREWTPKDSNEKRVSQNVVASQVAVAITRWDYVAEVRNVRDDSGGGSPRQQTQTQAAPQTEKQADPFENSGGGGGGSTSDDPFGEGDPFGGGDDDPFAIA